MTLEPHKRIPLHDHSDRNSGGQVHPPTITKYVPIDPDKVTSHTQLDGVLGDQHHAEDHVLATDAALGTHHTISGGVAGYVLRALGATTAKFMQLVHADLGSVGVNDHHNRDHASTHGPAAADALKLDDLASPDDNTDLNASTSAHGLLKKLPNDATKFLDGQGNFSAINVSGGNFAAGSSFPGSPATNDLYFRTDLGLFCFYDGTRWVTVTLYDMSLPILGSETGGIGLSIATNNTRNFAGLQQDRAIWIVSVSYQMFAAATWNGSNYWSWAVKDTATGATITTISGAAFTSGQYNHGKATIGSSSNAAGAFEVDPTKTGSPGSPSGAVSMQYRQIVT